MPKGVVENFVGRKFGDWTVIGHQAHKSMGKVWLCQCICGMESAIRGGRLKLKRGYECNHRRPKQLAMS